jgi:demethylmenaquinone methyltransferase/2-methoxy-6-polyprenyl-1,4-benzoquinol methylase
VARTQDVGDAYFARTFDWMADRYVEQTRAVSWGGYDRWLDHVADLAAQDHPEALVDLGSGPGLLLAKLRERLGAVRLVAVDLSGAVLDALSDPAVERHCASVAEFAADHPERFDAATATFVLRDVEDPVEFLRDAARLLRRGGRLVILETHRPVGPGGVGFDLYFHHWLPWWGRVRLARDWPEGWGPNPYAWLSASQRRWRHGADVPAWLERAGFERVVEHRRPDDVVMLLTAVKA